MLVKLFLVVSLATLAVSVKDHDENELLHTALGSGTNLLREFSKLVVDDADKFSVDLNSLYKKYEVASKAEQARSYLQTQFKRGAELTNEYIKKADIEAEESLKKTIEVVKKEDAVLGDKLTKYYEKTCDIDRVLEDIIKYVTDSDKVASTLERLRSSLQPIEHKLSESLKKVESAIVEHIPKKGKGKK